MPSNLPGRPFTDLIGELQNGELLHDLTTAVYCITEKVMDTRKGGKLTLDLTITPTSKGTVSIAANFKAKEPEHDRDVTTFFVGDDYDLTRRDPNQPDLPLRAVNTPNDDEARPVEMPSNQPVRVVNSEE